MKKAILQIVTGIMILALLAGCAGQAASSASAPAPGSADPAESVQEGGGNEEVTVRLTMWGDNARKEMFDKIFEGLKEEKNINVEITLVASEDLTSKLATQIASNTQPDVSWLTERQIPQFYASGNLEDISVLMDDPDYDFGDIWPSLTENYIDGDVLYALPWNSGPRVIFFNKTLFDEKGLTDPLTLAKEGKWTLDTMVDLAKQLSDRSTGNYGITFVNYSEPKNFANYCDFMWSQNASFFNDDLTEVTINTPEGIAALQKLSDMMFVDESHPKPGEEIRFETGKVAMARDTISYGGQLGDVDFEWDIVPNPVGYTEDAPVVTGVAAYVVFKGSENTEAAIETVRYITSKESMQNLVGTFPGTRKSVMESDTFLNATEKPSPEGRKLAFVDPMNNAKLFPTHDNYQAIEIKMIELMDLLYTRSATPAEVAQRMEDEVTPLLS